MRNETNKGYNCGVFWIFKLIQLSREVATIVDYLHRVCRRGKTIRIKDAADINCSEGNRTRTICGRTIGWLNLCCLVFDKRSISHCRKSVLDWDSFSQTHVESSGREIKLNIRTFLSQKWQLCCCFKNVFVFPLNFNCGIMRLCFNKLMQTSDNFPYPTYWVFQSNTDNARPYILKMN